MSQTKLYCLISGKYSGGKYPEIREIEFLNGEGYLTPGWTFEEAKQELIHWLEDKIEEVKNYKEEDYK